MQLKSNIPDAINALGFQAAWWLTVLGVSHEKPWLGPVGMLVFIALDHTLLKNKNRAEWQLIAWSMLMGTLVDSIFINLNWLEYAGSWILLPQLAPMWIIFMWAGFASTLNHSLRWLENKYWISAILGAVFGPLSYLAGEKLGAIQFSASQATVLLGLTFAWAIAVPMLVFLQKYFKRAADPLV